MPIGEILLTSEYLVYTSFSSQVASCACGLHVFTICIEKGQQNASAQMYALQRKTLSQIDVQTFLIKYKV